jgi:mannose-1-phosphate guanylyltransferase
LTTEEEGEDNDLFFVFNSDILCEFPLQDMIDYHKKHGKEGTLMVMFLILRN